MNMRFAGGLAIAPPMSRRMRERLAYADIAVDVGLAKEGE